MQDYPRTANRPQTQNHHMGKRTSIDALQFVTVYNQAESQDEVAKHFGVKVGTIVTKASNLRKKGVTSLKVYPRKRAILDYEALNKAAAAALKPAKEKAKAK